MVDVAVDPQGAAMAAATATADAPIVENASTISDQVPSPTLEAQQRARSQSSALHAALLEFAAGAGGHDSTISAAESAAATATGASAGAAAALPEELESIIREVAATGGARDYPWDALRLLLARKIELVLREFWKEAPDLPVAENTSFELCAVEPMTRSIMEARREGPPFTVQRLCELLAEPRHLYKSTRKFMLALQRTLLVMSTEEVSVSKSPAVNNLNGANGTHGGSIANGTNGASANGATADGGASAALLANGGGRKRKLPPEQETPATVAVRVGPEANGASC